MKQFNELPKEVQEEVKSILMAYDDVNVWFDYGRYSYADAITKEYAPDHEFIGTFKKSDVYTEKEQIENYINEFHDYPANYKGGRDYKMLKKMDDERETEIIGGGKIKCIDWIGAINEKGNFELTGKRVCII